MTVLAMVDDLFFLAQIQEAAKQAGVSVRTCAPGEICEAAKCEAVPIIILDLNHRSGAALDALRALKSDPALSHLRVTGFLSHVQGELAAAARAAGCELVLARSAFVQRLPQLLKSHP